MENEEILKEKDANQRKAEFLIKWRRNLFWILFVFIGVYVFLGSIIYIPWDSMMYALEPHVSIDFFYIIEYYTATILSILVLFLLTWPIRSNRYVWKSLLLPKKRFKTEPTEQDILADYYGRKRNGFKMLGWGLLIGFLMNFFTIACAWIHGDIKLYFEASVGQIPMFLLALVSVWIQSSSEEMWCRGFLYVRLHEHYPLWVAILVNSVLFGALHLFNDGAGVLSISNVVISGFAFSLLRWYTGNTWSVMGMHTGWNFTQAFLFGLPNSGLVSGLSIFHLHAPNGASNLIYDYVFGVEGALPALFADLAFCVVILVLAAKKGRLKELTMRRPKAMEMQGLTFPEAPSP